VSEEGFCEIEGMAERLTRAGVGSVDRVEAHESKVTAAICFGWAGRFDQAIDSAREAAVEAAGLSQHRALHSAMAQAFVLVPTGRFADLGERTADVLELAREDASNARTCMAAVVGIAGRALWLYEACQSDAAAAALDFMQRVRPPPTLRAPRPTGSFHDYFIVEVLRPLIGVEATGALLEALPPPGDDATSAILYLRAQIPTLALTGGNEQLRVAIADARQLARSACAPALGWIADWAAATQTANDDPAASLERALAATTALHEFGEPYTAARLLSDILPLTETTARSQVAESTVQRLTRMGALASAASLQTAHGMPASN
jgi:hypothetical protein